MPENVRRFQSELSGLLTFINTIGHKYTMTLTPQQQLKRRALLAKKELRENDCAIRKALRLPVLLDTIEYEREARERPPELASAASVQKITLTCFHLIDPESRTVESFGLEAQIKIEIFTTQAKPPSVGIYNASLHFGNMDPIYGFMNELSERPTFFIGLLRLSERERAFQLFFSNEQNPLDEMSGLIKNYGATPLQIHLEPVQVVFVVSDKGSVFRIPVDLARLAADLDCLKGAE